MFSPCGLPGGGGSRVIFTDRTNKTGKKYANFWQLLKNLNYILKNIFANRISHQFF